MKIFILALCLVSTSLIADDFVFDKESGRAEPAFIGQVKLFVGKILVTKKGETKPIEHGDRFAIGDTVKTQDKSILKILMIDDTVITLGANSEMEFTEFQFVDKTNRKSLYNLIKGQLSGEVKHKAKEDELRFKTKYVAMGVRGTRLLINYRTEGFRGISQFALTEGKAHVNKQAITKGEHLIFVHDSSDKNKNIIEKQILSSTEIESLAALIMDEEKDFRPLLPYYQLASVEQSSSLNHEKKTDLQEVVRLRLPENNPSWKQNLLKLNQQLKENHRKDK